jgi:hypothetical protein
LKFTKINLDKWQNNPLQQASTKEKTIASPSGDALKQFSFITLKNIQKTK